jgi:hypothetical protein
MPRPSKRLAQAADLFDRTLGADEATRSEQPLREPAKCVEPIGDTGIRRFALLAAFAVLSLFA